MDSQERVKKPEPVRTQPIRNWGVLFDAPGGSPPRAMPGTPSPKEATPPGSSVSRGVETGYRVVEEYLRQGQNVARAVGLPFPGGAVADEGLQDRMGAMFRSFSDFAGLWMDVMGRMSAGGASTPGVTPPLGTAGPFPAGGAPPAPAVSEAPKAVAPERPVAPEPRVSPEPQAGAPVALTLDIQSARRIEVSVDLRPRSSGLSLVVHELRAPEPDKPRLAGVSLEGLPDEERVVLRIHVPDDHPPGVYSGVILDARTSLPRGTLSVRIPPV